MGNKLPKSYEEFEQSFHKRQNNLSAKENFVEMLKSRGMLKDISSQEGDGTFNKEVFQALFGNSRSSHNTKTKFSGPYSSFVGFNGQNSPKKRDHENSQQTFIVKFGDGLPEKKIIIENDQEETKEFERQSITKHTCGWLLNEVISIYGTFFDTRSQSLNSQDTRCSNKICCDFKHKPLSNKKSIIGLKIASEGFNLPFDYYISHALLPLSSLPSCLTLHPLYSHRSSKPPSPADLQHLALIGKGGYSHVTACRKLDTGKLYAAKIIQKSRRISEEIVLNERNIHVMFTNDPFFVDIYWAFQDEKYYYLVTELCVGGSLYNLLRNHGPLDEGMVRRYASEVLVMIDRMHQRDVVYRDLKPENILIDSNGYLKLADFGLAKIVENLSGLNDTFCGSPEYMAPEMLCGVPHNLTIDFYTFGCLLHEMISGFPPHYSRNQQEMNNLIMFGTEELNFACSKELKQLISWCLNKEGDLRPQSVDDIKTHAFFKEVSWKAVENRSLKAPWIPPLKNHFNQNLTDIKIIGNQINEEAIEDDNFNTRSALRIQKDEISQCSQIREGSNGGNNSKETELSRLFNYKSSCGLLEASDTSNNIEVLQSQPGNTLGFEWENSLAEEFTTENPFVETDKNKYTGEQLTDYDSKSHDVATSELEEGPILQIRSFDGDAERSTKLGVSFCKPQFGNKQDVNEGEVDTSFGPHINKSCSIEQKNYETECYYTPSISHRQDVPCKEKLRRDDTSEKSSQQQFEHQEVTCLQSAVFKRSENSANISRNCSPCKAQRPLLSPKSPSKASTEAKSTLNSLQTSSQTFSFSALPKIPLKKLKKSIKPIITCKSTLYLNEIPSHPCYSLSPKKRKNKKPKKKLRTKALSPSSKRKRTLFYKKSASSVWIELDQKAKLEGQKFSLLDISQE
ncbi:unnamed protein product [Moneuplotes crassus]|uniref:Protein kinase domain-containing protein n=1 Tax=Euplotes crassus TaxID=5936 RepID=A0AAD1XQ39_EUPCR|nr:unnamed protein product [Moneuplotes crassus]